MHNFNYTPWGSMATYDVAVQALLCRPCSHCTDTTLFRFKAFSLNASLKIE